MSSPLTFLELPHTRITLFENDILEIQLEDDFFYSIKEAKEISSGITAISDGKKCMLTLVAGQYSICDEETRKFISSDEISDKISALALVPNSLAQEMIARFILNFDKPKIPTRIFHKKAKAMQWLLSLKVP